MLLYAYGRMQDTVGQTSLPYSEEGSSRCPDRRSRRVYTCHTRPDTASRRIPVDNLEKSDGTSVDRIVTGHTGGERNAKLAFIIYFVFVYGHENVFTFDSNC